MDKFNKTALEITVRISLTFQEAPDVHTLLAMTPVRQRGKLVRLALERYIRESGHPAGSHDLQIEVISTWLKNRKPDPYSVEVSGSGLSQKRIEAPSLAVAIESSLKKKIEPDQSAEHSAIKYRDLELNAENIHTKSQSMKRWLES